jgi:hypothetical protein
LTHEDDRERPESGAIIEKIQTSLNPSPPSATILDGVVGDILKDTPAGLTSNGKKKAKKNFTRKLLLCRRLLLAGAGSSPVEKTLFVWRAVFVLNLSLAGLVTSESVGAPCPGWKAPVVEELISVLRRHGAKDWFRSDGSDIEIPYDLGKYTYSFLMSASKPERKKALLGVIRSRFASPSETSSANTDLAFLDDLTWSELLPL